MGDNKQPKRWRSPLTELSAKMIAGIVGGVVTAVLAAVLIPHFVGTSSPMATAPTSAAAATGRDFTIEDALYHGTWELISPTAHRLQPRNERPENARAWLGEGTSVAITCAAPGATYPVIYERKHQRWHWWARTPKRGWIAIAAFKETRVDGSQGFRQC
jgi:hypothetical protein